MTWHASSPAPRASSANRIAGPLYQQLKDSITESFSLFYRKDKTYQRKMLAITENNVTKTAS